MLKELFPKLAKVSVEYVWFVMILFGDMPDLDRLITRALHSDDSSGLSGAAWPLAGRRTQ
jgi:hypothetical protein